MKIQTAFIFYNWGLITLNVRKFQKLKMEKGLSTAKSDFKTNGLGNGIGTPLQDPPANISLFGFRAFFLRAFVLKSCARPKVRAKIFSSLLAG